MELFVSEPRHGCCRIRELGGYQVGIVGSFVDPDRNILLVDDHGGGDIQEVTAIFLYLGVLIFATDALNHEPVQRTGQQSDLEIEIHFEPDHGRQGIEMEKQPEHRHVG